ncbi:Fur family transcriptional regulator [Pseudorhodoferax sp.]|uniref:Fur family transcriptional regulator n=1 Tax=Pseudorhodoferax sp. TaxID=1993553 RepID=UPI0039E52698
MSGEAMSLAGARATLDQAQLRATRCRLAVLQVFHAAPQQRLTVDAIAEQLLLQGAWISVPSIYKTVRGLVARQVLEKDWHDSGRSVFWLRGHGAAQEHQIACRCCQRSIAVRDAELARVVGRICDAHGLRLGAAALRIQVICAACQDDPGARRRMAPCASIHRSSFVPEMP